MTDPGAVVAHLKNLITTNGGSIREESPVRAVTRSGAHLTVHLLSGEKVEARHVISTLGPALDLIDVPPELKGPRPLWCKGFNVTIKRQLDPTYGIAAESSKGRLFFCVPRDSGTAIGTWYVPHPDPAVPPAVTNSEIAEFLTEFNAALPSAKVAQDEILHIDAGILPMHGVTTAGPNLIAHERIFEKDGYTEVLSTKYTTFRSQARATLAAAKIG